MRRHLPQSPISLASRPTCCFPKTVDPGVILSSGRRLSGADIGPMVRMGPEAIAASGPITDQSAHIGKRLLIPGMSSLE